MLTTVSGAKRLSQRHGFHNVTGLHNWETHRYLTVKGREISVTAVPACHRPPLIAKSLEGDVIGFIIQSEDTQYGDIYISGDTRYYHEIDKIAHLYNIGTAILNVGAGGGVLPNLFVIACQQPKLRMLPSSLRLLILFLFTMTDGLIFEKVRMKSSPPLQKID